MNAAETFSGRVVLPLSAAVRLRPFTADDHATAAIIREATDLIDARPAPAASVAIVETHEHIEMSGVVIRSEFRTSGHIARRRIVTSFANEQPLEIVADPVPFATVPDDSLRGAASEALRQMNSRRPSARRTPRAPSSKPPIATSTGALVVVLVLAGLTVAAGIWAIVRALS